MKERNGRQDKLRRLGHGLLGPLANLFMVKLHAHLQQTDPAADRILFMQRGGHRIKFLYELWLDRRSEPRPQNALLFRTSRMMAIKAAYGPAPELATTALGSALEGESLDAIVRSVLRAEQHAGPDSPQPYLPPQPLHEFLQSDTGTAERVRRHMRQQSRIFSGYLEAVAGPAERLLLVDTGWRGTQQLLFQQAFGDWHWSGLYFGCIGRAEILDLRPENMIGLVFDSEHVRQDDPATALVEHRHLIESLFEPDLPSVERVGHSDIAEVRRARNAPSQACRLPDPLFEGVTGFIREHATDSLSGIQAAVEATLPKLTQLISTPDRTEAALLSHKPRSLDLGRPGSVAVLLPPSDRHDGDTPEQRISEALWRPGQAAMEFSGARRERAQRRLLTAATSTTIPTSSPEVAIITRTKDRPLLLTRAARSVAAQSYRNFLWVVVNDGGDPDPVREILAGAAIDPARIRLCSFEESQGMEAASNAGINACGSELLVIHDDDDSWEPGFLQEGVEYLESNKALYDGVVCHSTYIAEDIRDGRVLERERRPFNAWLASVHLAEMAVANPFPPISFLFRRALWEQLGGYDERLPVLGDWDFNLRFLLKADIGVLAKPLANYHHRISSAANDAYANSDVAARNPHIAYNAVIRNKYLRAAGSDPAFQTLAMLMGQAYGQEDMRARLTPAGAFGGQSGSGTLDNELRRLRSRNEALQRELRQRGVLLHMTVSDIIAQRGLSVSVDEMVRHLSGLADSYARKAGLAPPNGIGRRADSCATIRSGTAPRKAHRQAVPDRFGSDGTGVR